MPALALSAMAQAATPDQLAALGAGVLRRAGRPEAGRAVRLRARGRQRRAQPAHPRAPRRRRLGHRRPQDLDRQRRHRQRARRQRHRRSRARPPRARRCSSCPAARPGCTWCASSRSSAAVPRTPPSCGSRTAGSRREPARRRRRSSSAGCRRRATGRTAARRRWARSSRPGPMVAAQALGIARAALEFACDYASEREAFGEAILEKQGISFPLADLAADLDAARLLTWRASWLAAQGHAVPPRRGLDVQAQGVRGRGAGHRAGDPDCGGYGYVRDLPVEKWYRDAKLYTIFEGTSEIQRVVIGRTLDRPGAAAPPPAAGRGRAAEPRPSAGGPGPARWWPARRCASPPTPRRR